MIFFFSDFFFYFISVGSVSVQASPCQTEPHGGAPGAEPLSPGGPRWPWHAAFARHGETDATTVPMALRARTPSQPGHPSCSRTSQRTGTGDPDGHEAAGGVPELRAPWGDPSPWLALWMSPPSPRGVSASSEVAAPTGSPGGPGWHREPPRVLGWIWGWSKADRCPPPGAASPPCQPKHRLCPPRGLDSPPAPGWSSFLGLHPVLLAASQVLVAVQVHPLHWPWGAEDRGPPPMIVPPRSVRGWHRGRGCAGLWLVLLFFIHIQKKTTEKNPSAPKRRGWEMNQRGARPLLALNPGLSPPSGGSHRGWWPRDAGSARAEPFPWTFSSPVSFLRGGPGAAPLCKYSRQALYCERFFMYC